MRFANRTIGDQKWMDLISVSNVILLLVFFFLLSWSFILQPGIEVHPPTTSFHALSQQGQHMITLKANTILFDEKSVDAAGAQKLLKEAAEKSADSWITINADESVSHGQVQQIVAMVLEKGLKVTLATQQAVEKPVTQ